MAWSGTGLGRSHLLFLGTTWAVMPTLKVNLVLAASVRQILGSQRAVLLTLVATLVVSVAMSLAASTVNAVRFVREQRAAALGTQAGTGG
jgi:hypothetical protein